ncbi:unnamed protein product [Effrenium voratum]|uniref:USP domain-containing protein n=1 Tax=Effrenium voratum TaxID=2562239 RepID=A0AA36N466_9DINO|nr:unnamed protein product [Effrenium voratum]
MESPWAASSSEREPNADRLQLNVRGLENEHGANHCFLNVVIQAFWNLRSFRRRLLDAEADDHSHARDSGCCYCALKSLFQEYAVSTNSTDTLPPDCLREALSGVYDERRFKLGDMEDATETIETILGILHASNLTEAENLGASPISHHIVEQAGDVGCHPLCLAHEVFGLEYVDVLRCTFCGANGEPSVSSSYLYTAYVSELLQSPQPKNLHEMLKELCQQSLPTRKCLECNSRKTVVSERWLTRSPCTFILSLVWPSSTPGKDAIWVVLSMIQPQLRMDQIFHTETSASSKTDGVYSFHGMICYCGMHYVALFWCPGRRRWVFLDDTCVQEKEDWTSATRFLMSGHYLPTLIFYESSEEAALAESLEELKRQVNGLEEQSSCAAM